MLKPVIFQIISQTQVKGHIFNMAAPSIYVYPGT